MDRTVTIVVIALGFIGLSGWWLETRFGPDMTVAVLLGITHLLAFAGGAVLSFAITKGSLRSVNDYAKQDAMVDRFRLQSFKEMARGGAAREKANAQIDVINTRRVDRLASERAKLLMDLERQKWEGEMKPVDTWDWDASGNDVEDSWE